MNEETKAAMLKIIEEKKRKSASQSGMQRGSDNTGNITRNVPKKYKKGGLFDK